MKRVLTATLAAAALVLAATPSAQAQFGLTLFDTTYSHPDGSPVNEAGSHPYEQSTSFLLSGTEHPEVGPDEPIKDLLVAQIPGMVGNLTALPACTGAEFLTPAPGGQLGTTSCPRASVVGLAGVTDSPAGPIQPNERVYNLEPAAGSVAKLGFWVASAPVMINLFVNPAPPHNVLAYSQGISQAARIFGAKVVIWGTPADPVHDSDRGGPLSIPVRPFLTMPRACQGPLQTTYEALSWLGSSESGFDPSPPMEDCGALDFSPEVAAAPTTNRAESPSGFDFSIEIDDPGLTDPAPGARADSDLKKAVVTLPEGVTVNAAAAGGLAACSEAQLAREDYDSGPGEGCPQASRVAAVAVATPLLHEQLSGSIFLAEPYANPLGELLAGYLVLKQPQRGIVVKLTGAIETDPGTGQITASFDQNPQLPFSNLEVSFFGGAKGPLTTPQTCGDYEIQTALHPWSGNAHDVSTQPFSITQAPGGGPCPSSAAQLPHSPAFDAGTVSPIAGAHSPFLVNLRRQDGSQRFAAVTVNPPQGLVAKLAATPACSDGALAAAAVKTGKAEQAAPSCPPASQVGNVHVAAGAGPAPYNAPAKAYLAGPYKGAPLSMAVIAPAVAGPFDLGTVVNRIALHVNPRTAEITAASDPLPTILAGIPLDIRSVSVRLDKPDFTLNPTSCDPMAVSGLLTSTLGAIAPLHSRFQLAECTRLGFKPKMALRLKGATKRAKYPALTATLWTRPGDANIANVSVALPRSEFLAQEHIRTVCTRVQWAADQCPAAAIYGHATVTTPLLGYELSGPVYLRSSDNPLPDLVPDLRGPAQQPIRLEAAGRTDSIKSAIRNSFDFVPDAPFSKFVLRMQGGEKGLLVNSRDICGATYRATVKLGAHNGKTHVARPKLKAQCAKKGKKGKKSKRGHKRAAR